MTLELVGPALPHSCQWRTRSVALPATWGLALALLVSAGCARAQTAAAAVAASPEQVCAAGDAACPQAAPLRRVMLQKEAGVLGQALAPDAKSAVMVAHGERVLLLDTGTGALRHSLPMRSSRDTIMGTRFSPDGTLMGVSVPDGTVLVWETATGKSRGAVKAASDFSFHYAIASSGALVALEDDDFRVVLCDLATGKVIHIVSGALDAIAFSPDGRRLAVALGSPGTPDALGIWDVGSKQPPRRVATLPGGLQEGAFSPDGTRFAILKDGVRIVDLASGKETPLGDVEGAAGINFSPDGRRVVTSNGPAMVWDAVSGRLLFRAPGAPVADARISPDGRVLVTLGYDDSVTSWDLPR